MATKLTRDLLTRLGFHGEGKDITGNPCYRLPVPYNSKLVEYGYHYDFQIVLHDWLPDTNPNSGVLSLYHREIKDCHMFCSESEKVKLDFVLWEEDDGKGGKSKGGIKYINDKETNFIIAHHVNTLERLNAIYTAITRNKPLKPRPVKKLSAKESKRLKENWAASLKRHNKQPITTKPQNTNAKD